MNVTLPKRHLAKLAEALKGGHPAWTDALNVLRERVGTGAVISLCGARGTGKTQLCVALCWYAKRGEIESLYVTAYELFTSIKATYSDGAGLTEQRALNQFFSPKLLIIDELNECNHTTWEGHVLTHIVDRRYAAMKDTVLVSNYTRETFPEAVGPSIISRMEETGGYIECRWPSFRNKERGGAGE